MVSLKKIVCAVDFSEASAKVAAFAEHLAAGLAAEVVVLYVAPSLSRYTLFAVQPGEIRDFVASIIAGAKSNMEDFLTSRFKGLRVVSRVEMGYAPEAILAVAEEEGADMIVMGTHGRQGLDRILFGSVAEKVVKMSKIPVLTVRPE